MRRRREGVSGSAGVEAVDDVGEVPQDRPALHLQRRGQVAVDLGEVRRQDGEPIADYLRRLGEIEAKVKLGKLTLLPKLTHDEICPQLAFDFNQSTLPAESSNTIDRKLASWLKMYPEIARGGLVAEGWADSIGTDEVCRKVSLQRAQTVAEYITSTLGCKVTAVGKGKSFDPPNTSEENKQQNRRVVIKRAAAK